MHLSEALGVRGADEVSEACFGSRDDVGTGGASGGYEARCRVEAWIVEREAAVYCYALAIWNGAQKRDGNEARGQDTFLDVPVGLPCAHEDVLHREVCHGHEQSSGAMFGSITRKRRKNLIKGKTDVIIHLQ